MKKKKQFTFVFTYTISDAGVADEYKAYLTATEKDGGLGAEPFDQSTYGTTYKSTTALLLKMVQGKLLQIYQDHNIKRPVTDCAFVLRADGVFNTGDKNVIDLFDVFDFE